MGYGGSVSVNLGNVQLDFEALIDGLCGPANRTLSDVEGRLVTIDGRLYSNDKNAAEWLVDIDRHLHYGNKSAASLLADIEGRLTNGPVVAVLDGIEDNTYDIKVSLGGMDDGPVASMEASLRDIAMYSYVFGEGGSAQILSSIRTVLAESLRQSGGLTVADILYSIYQILEDVWDYNNHQLRVSVAT